MTATARHLTVSVPYAGQLPAPRQSLAGASLISIIINGWSLTHVQPDDVISLVDRHAGIRCGRARADCAPMTSVLLLARFQSSYDRVGEAASS